MKRRRGGSDSSMSAAPYIRCLSVACAALLIVAAARAQSASVPVWSADCLELSWETWSATTGAKTVPGLRGARDTAAIQLGGTVAASAELRTATIDLSTTDSATLEFRFARVGLKAGDELRVEYLSSFGDWLLLERILADDRPQPGFATRRYPLPLNALHDRLQVRWAVADIDRDEAWYLADAAVTIPAEPRLIRVQSAPVAAEVRIVASSDEPRTLTGRAPFTFELPTGRRAFFIAPPIADGLIFSQWVIDAEPAPARQRAVPVDVESDLLARAEYVSPRGEHTLIWFRFRSEPIRATLLIGPENAPPLDSVATGGRFPAVRDEHLRLTAKPENPAWRLSHWLVGDDRVDSTTLELNATTNETIRAVFYLPGDFNGDQQLSLVDVEAIILALGDPEAYARRFPGIDLAVVGDIDGDGLFNEADVEAFVDLLVQE